MFGVCFLCSHLFTGVFLGGCGCVGVFSGKQGCKLRGSKHAVGFTFNTVERLARMLPPLFLVRPVVLWGVWGWWCVWWVVCDLYSGCEHLYFLVVWFCLVLLGIRWMPWHQELMKDVAACDMPRGVGERALIRGCPNGGT